MKGLLPEDVTLQRNSISSQMIHPDWVIWTKQGKKKKKKRKNSNSLANVDPLEDVTLPRNLTGSEMVHSDTEMSAEKGKKKKRKRGGKNLNALANVNLIQQPVNNGTCLETDSRLEQSNVEVEDCDNIPNTSFSNLSLSNDSNISGRNSGLIVDSRSILEVKVNQVPEANVNPVSMIVERSDQVCAKNGFKELSLDAPLAKKKRKRKKGRKILNAVSSNDVQFDGLSAPSIFNSSLDNELIQLATTSTGLVVDSEVLLHGAELGLPVKSLKEIHQSTRGINGEISCVNGGPFAADLKITQEADTNYFSKVVESDNQKCMGTISISQGLNAGAMRTKRKKKKGRAKNQISLTSNNEPQDNLKFLSLVSENPIYNDSIQHPVIDTCLMAGSKEVQHNAEVGQIDDNDKGNKDKHTKMNAETTPEADIDPIHKVAGDDDLACSVDISENVVLVPLQAQKTRRKKKKKNLNTLVSSVTVPSTSVMGDPELMQHITEQQVSLGIDQNECATKDKNSSGEDSSGIIDAKVDKISVSQDMDPIRKVAGDDDLACSVDVSEKMVMVPLQAQKTKRKKKKKNLNAVISSLIMSSTSVTGDPDSVQHSTEQGVSQGIYQNECATKDKNCSGEDISGIIDAKVDETSVSQDKAVGNIHGGEKRKRKIRGNNLNLEPEKGVISSNDLLEEQQVKRAKLNAVQNVGIARMLTGSVKKKLLVLDLNGLLADVVGDKTVTIKADGHVAGKKIFKRPFCEDFLQFCFNRFTVGVWSSRRKENVDKVLQVLMPEMDRSMLAFVWNQSHCTRTGFQTLENIDKPLFLKELSKLWKNENRKFSSKVGDYDKSNTLLLDDSPYKALLNPAYTAIFPTPYQYQDQNDDGLGPRGDLRVYLEGLALAEDVQEYVEKNPFGQNSITKSDPSWSYYAKVIHSMSKKRRRKRY